MIDRIIFVHLDYYWIFYFRINYNYNRVMVWHFLSEAEEIN